MSVDRGLYPPLQPYASGTLDVGDGHDLYYELCGNPEGKPALFLHGGPGGGCHGDHRRLFDPQAYKIVLFDQRGCGRSRPLGGLQHNTTDALVADIERLRLHLGVERFVVLGGSWGATLALLYGQRHRAHVDALVLRGAFTGTRAEVAWLYQHGASQLFPEAWAQFVAPIPPEERDDLVGAYARRILSGDEAVARAAAAPWCDWEGGLMTLAARKPLARTSVGDTSFALAKIGAHYFVHACFLPDAAILKAMPALAGCPGVIVQGRYDVVTPAATAFALHQAWPGSRFVVVPDAGHATTERGVAAALVTATDGFR